VGFVKDVGFKPGVKVRGNQNAVDEETKGADSRDKVEHNKRSDELFFSRG